MRISTKLALASVSLISLTTPVYAAETAAAAAADATNKDDDAQIVVTGTPDPQHAGHWLADGVG